MTKLSCFFEKHENIKKWIVALLINVAVVIALFLMFTPAESKTDYDIKIILCGASGYGSSAYLPQINYLLGLLLQLIQKFIPMISCYEAISYIALFAAFTVLTFVIIDFKHIKRSLLILFPIFTFWGFEGYIKLTYYKTAGITAACGMFVFFAGLSEKKKYNKADLIIGLLLSILGCLFCYRSLFVVVPVMIGVLLIKILKDEDKKIIHTIMYNLLPTIVLIGAMVAITVLGSSLFKGNFEWKAYQDNIQLYDDITDGKLVRFEDNVEGYQNIGISENDYKLMSKEILYADTEVLDAETLNNIKGFIAKNDIYSVRVFLRKYPVSLIKLYVIYGVVLLMILLCFSKHKKYKWLMISYPLIIALCIEYILYTREKLDIQYFNVVLWFAAALFITSFVYKQNFDHKLYAAAEVATLTVAIITVNLSYNYLTSKTYDVSEPVVDREAAKKVIDKLTDYEDTLFVFSKDEYVVNLKAYNVFRAVPERQLDNILFLPSYIYPSQRVSANNFGYENIYANLCNEDVYYSSFNGEGDVQIINDFIREHYNDNAEYTFVESEDNLSIYKFYDKSQITPQEVLINSWTRLGKNIAEPLKLMKLIEENGELRSASIITDTDTGINSLLCYGRLDRESNSGKELSSYLYDNDYIGCKISIDDITPYHYLFFMGQKLQDHGQPGVYIYDSEGICICSKQVYYYNIDGEQNSYLFDVSYLTGQVEIIINGGYTDVTGNTDSQFVFSDITLY